MKKLFKEFAEFINKGNALALAIGVIIGGAFTAIVTSINEQIITPILGWAFGGFNLSDAGLISELAPEKVVDGETIPAIVINWGSFIQAVINFLLTAIVLFTIFKVVSSFREAARKAAEKIQEAIHKDDEEEVVVEEAPVVPEVVVEEPTPSAEVVLLTEIRDLLSKKDTNE